MNKKLCLLFACIVLAATQVIIAAGQKRAKPPKWKKKDTDVFFADATQKLVGQRPAATRATGGGPAATTPGSDPGPASAGSFTWARLISSDTLENEVKSLQKQVSESVTTLQQFKGGGYKDGRREFSELAVLFGIIAQYDGDVRWKQQSAGIRDLMARAGQNCKVGTDASYSESKLRKKDLEDLVQGDKISTPSATPDMSWVKVSGRPPLMQRLEQAQQQGLAVWTANAGDFSKNSDKVLQEAQLIAALSEVIQREGYEFADDETYLGFAKQMRDEALQVADAVKQKNFEQARKATGQISKACGSCHEGFRS